MKRFVWRCLLLTQSETELSLMMYPIPNPFEDVDAKPNSLSAGLPQLDVDNTSVVPREYPGSE